MNIQNGNTRKSYIDWRIFPQFRQGSVVGTGWDAVPFKIVKYQRYPIGFDAEGAVVDISNFHCFLHVLFLSKLLCKRFLPCTCISRHAKKHTYLPNHLASGYHNRLFTVIFYKILGTRRHHYMLQIYQTAG